MPSPHTTATNFLISVGSRLTHIHLLSGGILPLLSLLESTLARHAHSMSLSKEVCSLKVVRMRLDDGRRVIGVRYPLPLISDISSILHSITSGTQVQLDTHTHLKCIVYIYSCLCINFFIITCTYRCYFSVG